MEAILNTVTKIANDAGRDYITPEDVQQAMKEHRNDPHRVRIDVLEVLGKQTAYGAEDSGLCSFVAFSGPEPLCGARGMAGGNGCILLDKHTGGHKYR